MKCIVKKAFLPAYVKKSFYYDGFCVGNSDVSNILGSSKSKNCVCLDGMLSTGAGMEEYTTYDGYVIPMSSINKEIKQVASYRYRRNGYVFGEKILFLTTDNHFYIYESAATEEEYVTQCGVRTKFAFGMDANSEVYTLICGSVGVWYYDENGTLKQVSKNASCGICLWCADRLFFVNLPYALSYTKPCEPTVAAKTAGECGKIEIPSALGKIVGLGALKDFLYVFTEQGILRMRVRDGAENFSFEEVGYNGGKIFYDGVASGSGSILFMATDGLYLFDGRKAEKICRNLSIAPSRENQSISGLYADGFFYMQYVEEGGEIKRICVSSDGKTAYFAFAVEGLSDGGGKGLFIWDQAVKMISKDGDLPSGEAYTFESKELSLGSEKKKTLKTLTLYGEGECVLKIITDGKEKSFDARFEKGVAVLPVRCSGEKFILSFTLKKGAKIKGAKADVVALKRT